MSHGENENGIRTTVGLSWIWVPTLKHRPSRSDPQLIAGCDRAASLTRASVAVPTKRVTLVR
jgi:hypothetical protein